MKLQTLLTVLLFFHQSFSINEDLIEKFFEAKLSTKGIIFNCNSKKETLNLIKTLMSKRYRISTFDMAKNFSTQFALAKEDNNLAVIVDGDCKNAETVFIKAAQNKYFFDTYRWLIFGSNYDNLMEKMKKVPLEINVDVTVAISTFEDDKKTISKWMLYNIYNHAFRHGGQFQVQNIGFYNVSLKEYDVELKGIKYFNRRNMTGITFQSLMVVPENITITLEEYLASDKNTLNNTFSRFHSKTVKMCQEFYNFTNNVSLIHSWGYQQPDGDVNGMMKQLKSKRTDFGTAAAMYRKYRARVADFGHGTWNVKSTFIFRHPKNTLSSFEIFLRPLVESVWLTTVGITVLLILILRIILTKQTRVLNSNAEDAGHADWGFLVLYGIGELCQQGYALIPTFVSGKIVTFTVLLYSFLIYQFYSASIVSLLLAEPPKTIKTLRDLLNSNLEAGCEDSLFDIDYFKKTTDPVAIDLYHKKIERGDNRSNFFPPHLGLQKVTKGGYAFHAQTSTSYPVIETTFSERVICSLDEVKMYPDQFVYMVTQKRSPFKELFNYCLSHQIVTGVNKRLRTIWHGRKPSCRNRNNYLKFSVGLKESYCGLLMLGFGYVLCLLLFSLELLWERYNAFIKDTTFEKINNLKNAALINNIRISTYEIHEFDEYCSYCKQLRNENESV